MTLVRSCRSLVFVSIVLMIIIGIVATGPVPVAADSDDHELSVPGAIETPSKTVSIDSSEYEVSGLATVDDGDSLVVDVTVPEGTDFNVDLYNSEKNVEDTESGSGTEQVRFDTGEVDSGSYMIALYVDGNYVDVFPVVIASHDVTTTHPTEVSENGEAMINTTVTGSLEDLSGVEVVIWNEDTVIRDDATATDDDSYQLTIPTSDLEEGDSYDVYAVAQGTDSIEGEDESEALGVSHGSSLTISDEDDTEEDESDEKEKEDNGDTEEDESSEDAEEGESEEKEEQEDSDSGEDDGADSDGEGNTTDEEESEINQSEQSNETDDNVVQPNPETEDDDESDADAVPALGVQHLALGMLLVGIVCRVVTRSSD